MRLQVAQTTSTTVIAGQVAHARAQFWDTRFAERQNGRYITAPTAWLDLQPEELLEVRYREEEVRLRDAVLKWLIALEYMCGWNARGKLPLLEVGIGGGFLTHDLLAWPNGEYHGLDISPRVVEHAKQIATEAGCKAAADRIGFGSVTHLLDELEGKPDNLPIQDIYQEGSFLLVVCGEVLHRLVDDWHEAMDQISRVLQPGGVLLGYEPMRDKNDFDATPSGAQLKHLVQYKDYSSLDWISVSGAPQDVTFCGQVHTIYALQKSGGQ